MQNLIDNIQIERQIKKLRGIRKIVNNPMYLRILPSNLTLPMDHSEHNYKDNTTLPLPMMDYQLISENYTMLSLYQSIPLIYQSITPTYNAV